jgi:hypothetical protein
MFILHYPRSLSQGGMWLQVRARGLWFPDPYIALTVAQYRGPKILGLDVRKFRFDFLDLVLVDGTWLRCVVDLASVSCLISYPTVWMFV